MIYHTHEYGFFMPKCQPSRDGGRVLDSNVALICQPEAHEVEHHREGSAWAGRSL